jgi:hypothetical protein
MVTKKLDCHVSVIAQEEVVMAVVRHVILKVKVQAD